MADELHLRIGTWNEIKGKNPVLQGFGVDAFGKSYYLSIPYIETLVKSTEDDFDSLMETYDLTPEEIRASPLNPDAVVLRNPIVECDNCPGKTDPRGMRPSLCWWQHINSEYVIVKSYQPLKFENYTMCDYEFYVHPLNIVGTRKTFTNPKVGWFNDAFFYDIEVYTPLGDFTAADRKEDEITAISIVTLRNSVRTGYLLLNGTRISKTGSRGWKALDVSKISDVEIFGSAPGSSFDYKVVVYDSETELLRAFFSILNQFRPKTFVDYNGKTYDLPYIINRASLLKVDIPPFSQIRNLKPILRYTPIETSFNRESVQSLLMPGTVHIDLLYYYRHYYPLLPNHRLDTVSEMITGKGKTGLDIPTFYRALEQEDKVLLVKAAEYSLRDTIALYELWEKGIGEQIFTTAAHLSVNPDEFTGSPKDTMVQKALYSADPGLFVPGYKTVDTKGYVVPAKPGIYSDVHIYDYVPALLEILYQQGGVHKELAIRLERAPFDMIVSAFFYPGVFTETMAAALNSIVDILEKSASIVKVDKGLLYSKGVINVRWLRLRGKKQVVIYPTATTHVDLELSGEITYHGRSAISKPAFPALKMYCESFIRAIANGDPKPAKPKIDTIPFDDLVIEGWIKASMEYKTGAKLALAEQVEKKLGRPITKAKIKWFYSKDGAKVLSDETDKVNNEASAGLAASSSASSSAGSSQGSSVRSAGSPTRRARAKVFVEKGTPDYNIKDINRKWYMTAINKYYNTLDKLKVY